MLALHVSLLGLFGLWEMFVDIFDIDKRPRAVVAFTDGFEPRSFGRKPRCGVKISNCLLNAGQFVHISDVFLVLFDGRFDVFLYLYR